MVLSTFVGMGPKDASWQFDLILLHILMHNQGERHLTVVADCGTFYLCRERRVIGDVYRISNGTARASEKYVCLPRCMDVYMFVQQLLAFTAVMMIMVTFESAP